jgi:CubicO group peptidase (beta-lactamase class C family)
MDQRRAADPGPPRPPTPDERTEPYQAALRQIDAWPVEHAAAAVVGGDGTVVTHGDTAHVFRLASITKTLTATAAMVAVEEEVVTLDAPLDDRGTTLRHLLAHAGGYPFDGAAPISAPGRRRIYSNTGIEVAARAVEAAAGMPFADYFAEAVVEPLRLALELRGSPAHGAHASLTGLLPFVADALRPRLLAEVSATAMRTIQFPELDGIVPGIGTFRPCPWGLGFEIKGAKSPHWTAPACSAATFGHFGGAGTLCWMDPVADLALVALTDRSFDDWRDDALRLWPALGDAVLAARSMRPGGRPA